MSTSAIVACAAASFVAIVGGVFLWRSRRSRSADLVDEVSCSEAIFFPDQINFNEAPNEKGNTVRYLKNSRSFCRLLHHVGTAEETIDLCLFMVTSQELTSTVLRQIQQKDIRVRLIVDDANINVDGSQVAEFRARGAFVRSKPMPYWMHHKFAILDGGKVISGSCNWTMQAVTGNWENVIITDDRAIVSSFVQEFERLWGLMTE